MLQLPPLPSHLLLPLDRELDVAQRMLDVNLPKIGWREEDCVNCQGTKVGRTWMGAPMGDVVEYECPCVDQMVLHRYLGVHGIRQVLRVRGAADLKWIKDKTKDQIRPWIVDPIGMVNQTIGLVLVGESGTAKTLIATVIQRRLISAEMEGFLLPRTMFNPEQPLFNWKSELHESAIEMWTKTIRPARILIVDQLEGAHGIQDRIVRTIEDTLRFRSENGLLTIVTTRSMDHARAFAPDIDFTEIEVYSEKYPDKEISRAEVEHRIVRPAVL